MQQTYVGPSPSQPTSRDCSVESMTMSLSMIMHTFSLGVPYSRNNWKNHMIASFVSPSTITKAKGNMLRFSHQIFLQFQHQHLHLHTIPHLPCQIINIQCPRKYWKMLITTKNIKIIMIKI